MVYGSLTRSLQKIGLFPRKNATNVYISIDALVSKLEGVAIRRPYTMGAYKRGNHYNCAIPSYKEDIAKVVSTIADPVLDSHRQHMETQARLLE
jgi:hypothetical protein